MDGVNVGEATLVMVTDKAILVDGDVGHVWIPRSAIHDDSDMWAGAKEPGDLIVKHWFAIKKGWE